MIKKFEIFPLHRLLNKIIVTFLTFNFDVWYSIFNISIQTWSKLSALKCKLVYLEHSQLSIFNFVLYFSIFQNLQYFII